MRRVLAIVCGIAFGALAGCRDRPATPPGADAQTPIATEAPGATGTTPGAIAEAAVDEAASVGIARSGDYGEYLVDVTGRALYVRDRDDKGASNCDAACARTWPPLLATRGVPGTLDPTLDQAALSVIRRGDGAPQVAYHGRPLHQLATETIGQHDGHGVRDAFGRWTLLSPTGDPIAAPSEDAEAAQ